MAAAAGLIAGLAFASQAVGGGVAKADPTSIFDVNDGTIVSQVSSVPGWSDIFACSPVTRLCQPTVNPNFQAQFPTPPAGQLIAASFVADPLVTDPLAPYCPGSTSSDDPTVFPGNNTNGQTLSTMQYGSGSVPGNKDDLSNVYSALMVDPSTGHRVIYFGLERPAGNGDSHVDFEFFHSAVGLGPSEGLDSRGCPIGHWTGTRSVGDVLLSIDYTNGGNVPGVTVRTWNGTEYVVDTSLSASQVGAVSNSAPINCPTWDCRSGTGGDTTTVPTNNFTEGYLDIDSPGLGAASCLSSFDAHSRSSQSFTAQLEDFALGSFNTCDANIQVSPSGVNEVGHTHTFTAHVNVKTTGSFGPAPDGTTINFTNGGAGVLSASSCQTSGGTGSCSVTETSNVAGVSTVNASTDVTVAPGVVLHRTTDGKSGDSGPAVKRWVDGSIAITPTSKVNEVGHAHVFTVTVTALPSGTTPSFGAIEASVTPTPDLQNDSTCGSPTVSGNVETCTITINSDSAGSFTANASTSITYDDADPGATPASATVDRSTSGTSGPAGSGPATKYYVDASIAIAQTGVNATGSAHTFTITATALPGGTGTPTFDSITTTVDPTPDLQDTNTCASPTALSATVEQCTLTINSDSTGTFTADATVSVTMGGVTVTRSTSGDSGPGGSGSATKDYVDAGIAITPHSAFNEVNDPHTFTVTVTALPGSRSTAAFGPIQFDITPSIADTDNCSTPVTTPTTATCQITIDSAAAGTFTVNASDQVTFTSTDPTAVPLTATVTPSTAGNSGPGGSGPATKTYVDASVAIGPSADNEVGNQHVFTITATALPDGASATNWSITPSVAPAPSAYSTTCSTPTISANTATCTVTINSTGAGSYTANADLSVTIGGVTVTRSTSGTPGPGGSGPATKQYVDASVSITPSGVNEVGTNHVFDITVTADPSGATPVVFNSITPSATDGTSGPGVQSDTCAVPVVKGNTAECTMTISNATADVFTANATASVTMGTVTVTRSTSTNPGPLGSGPAVKRFVDASIAVSPKTATNGIGEQHVFTVTETAYPSGTTPSFGAIAVTVGPTPGTQSTTCGSPTVSGNVATCTITIDSNTAGTFTADAAGTVTFTDGDPGANPASVVVSRSTDGSSGPAGPAGSGSATKTYVSGSLRWVKHDDLGNLLGGATFRVCETASYSTPTDSFTTLATPVCATVVDNGALDQDPTDGNFLLTGMYLGKYTVQETAAPAGYLLDPTVQHAQMTVSAPDADLSSTPFVNTHLGHVDLTKTFEGKGLAGTAYSFTFELLQGASATVAGTVLETELANSANNGFVAFSTSLLPGQTYQMCEVMTVGWSTTLPAPTFIDAGSLNLLCSNFSVTSGQTFHFTVDNNPPPGGIALTIGYWKNWSSCGSNGHQAPVLDKTLLAAATAGNPIAVGLLVLDPTALGATPACHDAVDILSKTSTTGAKESSDPAFNMAAQLLAAELNIQAGAGFCPNATSAITQGQALLVAINFNGATHSKMTPAQVTLANSLQTTLNSYNNGQLC